MSRLSHGMADLLLVEHCPNDSQFDRRGANTWPFPTTSSQDFQYDDVLSNIGRMFELDSNYRVTLHAHGGCFNPLGERDFLPGGRFHPDHLQTNHTLYAHLELRVPGDAATATTSAFPTDGPAPQDDMAARRRLDDFRFPGTLPPHDAVAGSSRTSVSSRDDAGLDLSALDEDVAIVSQLAPVHRATPEDPHSGQQATDRRTSPGFCPSKQSSMNPSSGNSRSEQESTDAQGEFQYVRVGTQPDRTMRDGREIPTMFVTVAEVQNEQRVARFLAIPSWEINGVVVGCWLRGETLDDVERCGVSLDQFFQNHKISQLEGAVLDFVQNRSSYVGSQPEDIHLILECEDEEILPTASDNQPREGECRAVVNIIDYGKKSAPFVTFDLGIELSFSLTDSHVQTPDLFRQYFAMTRTVASSPSRTIQYLVGHEAMRPNPGFWIHILPQNSSGKIYTWGDQHECSIARFFNAEEGQATKDLYIEIHIKIVP